MIRQLRQNLSKCRERVMDEKLDLKTRERWTQLYNNTSTVLNQILKDRQLKDWERKMREIEEYEREENEGAMKQATSSGSTDRQQLAVESKGSQNVEPKVG